MSSLFAQIKPLMGWLAAVSLLTFITSLLLIPLIVQRLPADIFIRLNKRAETRPSLSPVRVLLIIFRNALAIFLVASGFIMLFIPGQGLLTMLIGLLLLSFPGKQKIILQLVRRKTLQKSLDWIRSRRNFEPFQWPD